MLLCIKGNINVMDELFNETALFISVTLQIQLYPREEHGHEGRASLKRGSKVLWRTDTLQCTRLRSETEDVSETTVYAYL